MSSTHRSQITFKYPLYIHSILVLYIEFHHQQARFPSYKRTSIDKLKIEVCYIDLYN